MTLRSDKSHNHDRIGPRSVGPSIRPVVANPIPREAGPRPAPWPGTLADPARAGLNVTRRQIGWRHTEPGADMAETTQRNEQQLLIGGKWVDASEGTYEIVNPATEEIVGLAPNASADDALAAAAAAKEAQPGWAAWSADDRGALMREAAAAIRAKSSELLPLVIAETGATATVGSRMQVPVAADRFERYARDPRGHSADTAAPPTGPGDSAGAGRDHRRHGQPPADRRGGLHHFLQLPHGEHGREGGTGAGRGKHRGGQARAARSAGHRGARAHPQRRRFPPGRGQPRQRQRRPPPPRWWTPTTWTASASPDRPRSA